MFNNNTSYIILIALVIFSFFKVHDFIFSVNEELLREYADLDLLNAEDTSEEKIISKFIARLDFNETAFTLNWAIYNKPNAVTPSDLNIEYKATGEKFKIYEYMDYFYIKQVKYDSINGRVFVIVKGGSPLPIINFHNLYMFVWDIENKKLLGRYHLKSLPNKKINKD